MVRSHTGPHRLSVRLDQAVFGRALIGGKGASLARLSALGAPVPPAYALTTNAYRAFSMSVGLPKDLHGTSERDLPVLRATLLERRLPARVARTIAHIHSELQAEAGSDVSLAVRSSATEEDSSAHSFAGLHDTVLDVQSLTDLEAAVRQCWASLWSDRAVSYRRARDRECDAGEIAVVIQQLVRSDISFIVFTVDPITGNEGHAVISASWGLGEAVVSGMVTPDHIVVGPSGEIVEHSVGCKELMVIPGDTPGSGTRVVKVPRMLQAVPVMSAAQASEIVGTARSISRRLGYPADLEGGIANGSLYLFQVRPITTLRRQSKLPPVPPAPPRTQRGGTPALDPIGAQFKSPEVSAP
jgi:phosphoenolpyruvate synthase/pyruvate phosphate dikinase